MPANAAWPPPFPPPTDHDPDSVGLITQTLRLNREQYEGVCQIAKELTETAEFREAVDLVARALCIAPSLDHEALEVLRAETGFADEVAA